MFWKNIGYSHSNTTVSATSSTSVATTPATDGDMGNVRKCSNCGLKGHTDSTCFQPGGKMEGRREEYLASRPMKPQAHLTSAEDVQKAEAIVDTTEEPVLTQEFAAMSLNLTNDTDFDSYPLSTSVSSPHKDSLVEPIILATIPLEPIVLAALPDQFNTALDSACTNHIIQDWNLFQSYNVSGAVPVKMANCGFLTTLAVGDVKFRLVVQGRTITWTLRNCLHAPEVPINLISVGTLQEHHMSITFPFQKMTIAFPSSHPQLGGLSFDAEVVHRLSLLHLNYIPVNNVQSPTIAFTSYQVPPISFDLWHCRFGHLGQDATWDMLTKDFATGITYKPTVQTTSRCIPCLISKTPQAPFTNNARRASKVCDLIHIDTCGPFPTLTPRKEVYFTAFLDDASNFGFIALLTSKDGAYSAWQKVEAAWTLKSGNPV